MITNLMLMATMCVVILLLSLMYCAKAFFEMGIKAGFGMALGEKKINDLADKMGVEKE